MAITVDTQFEVMTCSQCYVTYALTHAHQHVVFRDKTTFYCPNGHPQRYTGETAEKQVTQLKARMLELDSKLEFERTRVKNAQATAKRETTKRQKLEKRTKGAVCPFEGCHRHFVNLERHIATKHPQVTA